MNDKSFILSQVCAALERGDKQLAKDLAREQYPFERIDSVRRYYGELEATKIFIRDGFIDRYSGQRLVFPGALLLISRLLPEEFPAHPNWKMSESHLMYWELWPTVDHVIPVARGGKDDESNWVCTSMLRNSAKSNWTLEELGWELQAPGSLEIWDGLINWFVAASERDESLLETKNIKKWYRAAKKGLNNVL